MDRTTQRMLAAWSALLVLFGAAVWQQWFVCDDAYISFRYARNFADGHGLGFNLGDHVPVEGYSNLLWTLIAGAVLAVGADPVVVMPVLSVLCGVGLLLHAGAVAHRLGGAASSVAAGGVLAGSPLFSTWATGGLATMPAAWALFALVDALVLRPGRWAVVPALALVGLRSEGIAWVVVVCTLAALRAWWDDDRQARRAVVEVGGAAALAMLALTAWRVSFYGDWVANTARAKVGFSGARLARGGQYLAMVWAESWTPLLALLAVARLRAPRELVVGVMAMAVPIWCVVVGGDYMTWGRLLLAGLPFAAVAGGIAVRERPTAAVLVAVVAGILGAVPVFYGRSLADEQIRTALSVRATTPWIRSEQGMHSSMRRNARNWRKEGLAFAALGREGSLVTGAIGARSYYSGVFIHDRGGLVTRVTAPKKVDPSRRSPGHDMIVPREQFLADEPTWYDHKLLGGAPSADAIRDAAKSIRPSPKARRLYRPVLYDVEVDDTARTLLVLERAATQAEAEADWEAWTQRYSASAGSEGTSEAASSSD
jgi:hypothetical protein